MLRIPLAALASVAFLMLTPHAAQSQLVPRDPRQPTVILRPDLVATIDQSTRIVFAKAGSFHPRSLQGRHSPNVAFKVDLIRGEAPVHSVRKYDWTANG